MTRITDNITILGIFIQCKIYYKSSVSLNDTKVNDSHFESLDLINCINAITAFKSYFCKSQRASAFWINELGVEIITLISLMTSWVILGPYISNHIDLYHEKHSVLAFKKMYINLWQRVLYLKRVQLYSLGILIFQKSKRGTEEKLWDNSIVS